MVRDLKMDSGAKHNKEYVSALISVGKCLGLGAYEQFSNAQKTLWSAAPVRVLQLR